MLGMAAGSVAAGEINIAGLANTCNSCHGVKGVSAGLAIPNLAGLNKGYLKRVMLGQKTGERYSTIMGRLLKVYSDEEIAALADYYSALEWTPVSVKADLAQVNAGRAVMKETCSRCHDPKGDKNTDEVPRISGQWPAYIKLEVQKYVDLGFPHKKPSQRMAERATNLSDEQIEAVTNYLAGGWK
jgi:sulfide dehydrogenase cytochrome subunit